MTMRMTTNKLTAIAIGALLALGSAAFAQPPEPQIQGQPQPGPRGPAEPPLRPPGAAETPQRPGARAPDAVAREPNVDLVELVQRVAEETGREFLIHPVAATRVYLADTIDGTPSYPVLVSILRLHGFIVFESEGVVNIVPDAFARAVPTRIVQVDNDSIPDDETVTRVLTLPEDVSGAQLVPILRPMLPQQAHLTALQSGNKILIVDTYANVKRMTEVIRLLVGSVGL